MFRFSQDVEINFERRGSGKHILLCLHGFGASLRTWDDVSPFLDSSALMYLIDLKGFGLSSRPKDGRYSIQNQAEIIASFIRHEGLSGITLVGHSYGGIVALLTYFHLADNGPESAIQSLVLIDSAGYLQRPPFFISIPRIPIINSLLLNLIPIRWQAGFTLRRVFYDKSKVTKERINRYAEPLRTSGSGAALIAAAEQLIPHDAAAIIERIPQVRVPTQIIWGANDPAIPLEHGRRFHREIAHSRFRVIEKCGHVPHEEQPLETARVIIDFCL
jgi:pimeloyl-ACP methyl ester carboxylesterase